MVKFSFLNEQKTYKSKYFNIEPLSDIQNRVQEIKDTFYIEHTPRPDMPLQIGSNGGFLLIRCRAILIYKTKQETIEIALRFSLINSFFRKNIPH